MRIECEHESSLVWNGFKRYLILLCLFLSILWTYNLLIINMSQTSDLSTGHNTLDSVLLFLSFFFASEMWKCPHLVIYIFHAFYFNIIIWTCAHSPNSSWDSVSPFYLLSYATTYTIIWLPRQHLTWYPHARSLMVWDYSGCSIWACTNGNRFSSQMYTWKIPSVIPWIEPFSTN